MGDGTAHQGVQSQGLFHPVQRPDLLEHLLCLLGLQVGVCQDHVGGGHTKLLCQLFIGLQVGHICRVHALAGQNFGKIIKHRRPVVAHGGRNHQQSKNHQKHPTVLHDALGQPVQIGQQRPVPGLLQRTVQQENERWQDGHTAQNSQHHALGHDNAQIPAHGIAHEAQGHKPGNGGDGAAGHRGNGPGNGLGHGRLMVFLGRQLLTITVPQENGVVHGNGQLQHRRQGLGDVGNLPQEVVAS